MADDLDLDKLYTHAAYRDTTVTFNTERLDKLYTHAAYRRQNLAGLDADPYFGNVVLLCGFDGTDASTAFVDESAYSHVLTAAGNAQIDTAQLKYGAASALFDGSGDAITTPDNINWDLSNANADQFTVETWVRFNSLTGDQGLIGQWGATPNLGWVFRKLDTTHELRFMFSTTGSDFPSLDTSGAGLAINTWYHVAVDKDAAGKIRIYVDGVMKGSSTPANSAIFNSPLVLTIGAESSGSSRPLNGWLDELRITRGVARYASDSGYTVPTEQFPRFFDELGGGTPTPPATGRRVQNVNYR